MFFQLRVLIQLRLIELKRGYRLTRRTLLTSAPERRPGRTQNSLNSDGETFRIALKKLQNRLKTANNVKRRLNQSTNITFRKNLIGFVSLFTSRGLGSPWSYWLELEHYQSTISSQCCPVKVINMKKTCSKLKQLYIQL